MAAPKKKTTPAKKARSTATTTKRVTKTKEVSPTTAQFTTVMVTAFTILSIVFLVLVVQKYWQ